MASFIVHEIAYFKKKKRKKKGGIYILTNFDKVHFIFSKYILTELGKLIFTNYLI